MTKDEALTLALETLECLKRDFDADQFEWGIADEAITAIKEALAKEKALQALNDENERLGLYKDAYAEQEPVAYLCENAIGHKYFRWKKPSSTYKPIALYTSPPPQRKPQEFVCSTGLCHYRKPLTNDRAHQILLDMAKHIETFGDENITEQALSAECIRFILERVTAYGIKEEV